MPSSMYYGEKLNAFTHLGGAVLALAGAVVLVVSAALGGDPWKVVSVSVYGLTLVLLYTFSTLYHGLRGRAKNVLQKLDHQSIYLLIAGTYTPFCLVTLRGPWGWSLFGVVWGLAVLGGLQEFWARSKARVLSVVIYVVMGWAALVALVPLYRALGLGGFRMGCGGWALLHRGDHFLRARLTPRPRAWRLALVRAGGQRDPLRCGAALRAVRRAATPASKPAQADAKPTRLKPALRRKRFDRGLRISR